MRYAAQVEDDPLLPIGRAADAVGVSRSTLWRYIRAGHIEPHARTHGGHLRFRAKQLAAEIAAGRPVKQEG